MGAGDAPLSQAQGLEYLSRGSDSVEPPLKSCLSDVEWEPLQEHLPEGSRKRDAVGYQPMGFGALPQAGVARLALVTHPRLLLSPGTWTYCRFFHRCPVAMLHTPVPSPQRSKHNSTVTGRRHGDPSLASGILDSPALEREITSLNGDRGGQAVWAGQGSRGPAVLDPHLWAFKTPTALLHQVLVSAAVKPCVVSCVWSQAWWGFSRVGQAWVSCSCKGVSRDMCW